LGARACPCSLSRACGVPAPRSSCTLACVRGRRRSIASERRGAVVAAAAHVACPKGGEARRGRPANPIDRSGSVEGEVSCERGGLWTTPPIMDGDGRSAVLSYVHRVVNPYLYEGLWTSIKTNVLGFDHYIMEPCTSKE
jgi:hypothetical protein